MHVNLGIGILIWSRREQQTGRYGTVMLVDLDGRSTLELDKRYHGRRGYLIARIIEPRDSNHVDDSKGLYPRRPVEGQVHQLGKGLVFIEQSFGRDCIGIEPDPRPQHSWLNVRDLYCCRDCVVQLQLELMS